MNKVKLVGTVSSNVSSRWSTKSGQHVTWFHVDCVTGRRTDTVFVISFQTLARDIRDSLDKGMVVEIEGYVSSYMEVVGGAKRQAQQVVIEDIQFLSQQISAAQRLGG